MSPSLVNLPTETLTIILSNFCQHCCQDQESPDAYWRGSRQSSDQPSWYSLDRHALFSICLVSRHLCDIAQPILYHEFMPGYGDSWRTARFSWDGRAISFLRTVVQRPDLAALVKRVYIHPFLFRHVDEGEAQAALELAASARGVHLSKYLAPFEAEARLIPPWIPKPVVPELLGMLLACLPHLDRLSLQVDASPGYLRIPSASLKAAGVSGLPLKILDMSSRSAARDLFNLGYQTGGLLEMATPSLTMLNLHMCRSAAINSKLHLRTLRITHSRLGDGDLGALLSSCVGLETFVYEADYPYISPFDCVQNFAGTDHFQPSDAVRHLGRHKATLKSLSLDLRARGYYNSTQGGDIHPISSLKDFPVLEHLFLNSTAICNSPDESITDKKLLTRLLPPNIVSLSLAGNLGNVLPRLAKGLVHLAAAVSRGKFPNLKRIRCDENQRADEYYPVSELFASSGIDFSYESWPLSEATLLQSDVPPSQLEPMPLPDTDDDL